MLYPELRQLKFPGGTNNGGSVDKNPEETLLREYKDEVGVTVVDYKLVHSVYRHATETSPPHRQYFALVEFLGTVREQPCWDGKELLEPPHWRRVDKHLMKEVFVSHRRALERAIEALIL